MTVLVISFHFCRLWRNTIWVVCDTSSHLTFSQVFGGDRSSMTVHIFVLHKCVRQYHASLVKAKISYNNKLYCTDINDSPAALIRFNFEYLNAAFSNIFFPCLPIISSSIYAPQSWQKDSSLWGQFLCRLGLSLTYCFHEVHSDRNCEYRTNKLELNWLLKKIKRFLKKPSL